MKGLLFTYGLTYGGAVASLFNPYYGFLIYVAFSVLRPHYLWFWSVPAGNYSRIIAIALLVGWALHGFGDWQFGKAKWIVYSLLGYFGWQLVSALQADNQQIAWSQVELQAKIVLPFLVGLTLIDSTAKIRQLAWVIVLSMGYVAYEANMSFWAGNNWLRTSGFGSMDNNSICIGMVACAGLAFFLGLMERNWWLRLLSLGAAGLMAHAPMFGNSRGGMVALLVTGVVSFLLIPKRLIHIVIFVAAVACGIRLAGPEVIERFSTVFVDAENRDDSSSDRLKLWGQCWEIMKQRPLTGVGPDNWPRTAPQFGWPGPKECHSLWLNAGAELGFPGLTFLIAFYVLTLYYAGRLSRSKQEYEDPWIAGVARMVVASIVGFATAASFVSLDNLEPPYYTVLLAAGILKIAPAHAQQLYRHPQIDLAHHSIPAIAANA